MVEFNSSDEGDHVATEYEQLRAERIAENRRKLQELDLDNFKLADQHTSPLQKRVKTLDRSTPKKKKKALPKNVQDDFLPRRSSLRLKGIASTDEKAKAEADDQMAKVEAEREARFARQLGDIAFDDQPLINAWKSLSTQHRDLILSQQPRAADDHELVKEFRTFHLKSQGSTKLTQQRIYALEWHPTVDKPLVMVGDKAGTVVIWDVKASHLHQSQDEEDDVIERLDNGLHEFKPHSRPVSCLKFDPSNSNNLYSSSYDGSIRCMNIVEQKFEEVLVTLQEYSLSAFDVSSDGHTIWYSTNTGQIGFKDVRIESKENQNLTPTQSWELSAKKIGCIHLNPSLSHLVLTSGNDGHVRIWDMRKLKDENSFLKTFQSPNACTSAYWSADGQNLVSTSYDDHLRLYRNVMDPEKYKNKEIRHNNQTGRWVTNFKTVWMGSKDAFMVGNMKRMVDIYNGDGELVMQLSDPESLTAVPAVNASHFHPEMKYIASGNASGRGVIWSP